MLITMIITKLQNMAIANALQLKAALHHADPSCAYSIFLLLIHGITL